ncbi:methionyl-tRNA synthetase [Saitozyma podzolica]|uniref:Methionine--tRNA ligase, mitochondrial n=1 Tax=Saitozyma podzolica TaxID=1890683 RepID=A0A427XRK8_9TREE|nr:methionyl-tRNA synthetase [Saitozyma podzolica]
MLRQGAYLLARPLAWSPSASSAVKLLAPIRPFGQTCRRFASTAQATSAPVSQTPGGISSTPDSPIVTASVGAEDKSKPKPYFLTTPIFYVNASPHIGHLHSLLLTDVLARFSRLRDPTRPVVFTTGTDEHGLKIQQAAKAGGVDEQEFCDRVSERFRDLARRSNISHTDFVRTTEPRHYTAVEHFWNKLVTSGDIYKGTHSGWYSISDESFFAASQVGEKDGKMISIETGNEVVWEEEVNWKFRLGAFKDRLLAWAGDPKSVQPNSYRQDILRQIQNLEDLSISRPLSRVRWGVPVPGDPEQVIYVWVDALINYITVLGYPESLEGWPADAHIVGKDIIKFHAIHWPALLMSAGLEPPRTVLAHAHWTMARSKMSKSRGNVVDPIGSLGKWGVDGVRWYLMRSGGSLPDDADYSEEQLGVNYRLLADQIGNLVARISSPSLLRKVKRFDDGDRDSELDEALSTMRNEFGSRMEAYQITRACEGVIEVIMAANRLFTILQPWATDDSTKAIVYAYHSLRLAGILLQPIIPSKATELLDRLGVPPHRRTWGEAVWPVEVDTEDMIRGLREGKKKYKGHLFPQVEMEAVAPTVATAAAAGDSIA